MCEQGIQLTSNNSYNCPNNRFARVSNFNIGITTNNNSYNYQDNTDPMGIMMLENMRKTTKDSYMQ